MDNFLSFVTIDLWTLIFTWGNLLILFLLMKKLLFKPVTDILSKREQEVAEVYDNADNVRQEAMGLKSEYEARLTGAKAEAEQLMKNAAIKAQQNEEEIIKSANLKAGQILRRAEEDIEAEKKNAFNDLKNELSDMAVILASGIIEHDVDAARHREMIDDFIDSLGETS